MLCCIRSIIGCCFFFNDTATTEIYTLSLHDALPICAQAVIEFNLDGTVIAANRNFLQVMGYTAAEVQDKHHSMLDRKSTRLNSSHANISYAVFCLKKKNKYRCGTPRSRSARPTGPLG